MQNLPLILVADAQPRTTRQVSLSLGREGFRIVAVPDGRRAVEIVSDLHPDALLVDAALPGMSGIDVVREIRQQHEVPVILLTDSAGPGTASQGLDAGADDYLVAPFDPVELAARLRAIMRRTRAGILKGKLRHGTTEIDLDRRTIAGDGKPLPIPDGEWRLLRTLIANEGRILGHAEILTAVWGPRFRRDMPRLRTAIGQLRRRLGIPRWQEGPIRTVAGVGYAFDPHGQVPQAHSRRPMRNRKPRTANRPRLAALGGSRRLRGSTTGGLDHDDAGQRKDQPETRHDARSNFGGPIGRRPGRTHRRRRDS